MATEVHSIAKRIRDRLVELDRERDQLQAGLRGLLGEKSVAPDKPQRRNSRAAMVGNGMAVSDTHDDKPPASFS
jgi:hypothetical protein